ncbi:aminoglycoside phosphotransferase family protein [Agrobacterium vitis]|uniref:aminoglycoside phosphotransferase family protein n=1 Tax=Agrobacterium vitis TaxID=373 RepID=UPI0008726B6F|nr:aminoglycoside phosphotransferase family protein [Agrobacterium vitis]MCE6074851.1 phosphotransferase [Agrobacterium vitis]MCM2451035.1 aminoglycoside phosphotransferase family protein [Agrobacterium vitis]MCM2467744.1 aminoglycoside phosphotransferase family protein [Agrobacterium vitis]MUO68351.1 phosphotransferase [Agrobacterium vitis]MUO83431.1 phosphotransferase [Agrobacterium vitis]
MDDRLQISVEMVRQLIAGQFPKFSTLPIVPMMPGGWDNRSFRLGDGMIIRLPSADCYAAQVAKEQHFLPILAQCLPLPIPRAIAMGTPTGNYPFSWGIYGWIDGETALTSNIEDTSSFAADLGAFLKTLHSLDGSEGPLAGPHNFYRGGSLATYDSETRDAIDALAPFIDASLEHFQEKWKPVFRPEMRNNAELATALWEEALASQWQRPPVWLHGDVAPGNLLIRDGRLAAVIDFGCCGVGDPACDLAIAWTFLDGTASHVFENAVGHDMATWTRARGWALWKTLITLRGQIAAGDPDSEKTAATLACILHRRLHGNH